MSEIKCRVCGATPEQSESIYEYEYDTERHYQHRHAYQCVDFLLSENMKLRLIIGRLYRDWNNRGEDTTDIDQYSAWIEIEELLK